MPSLEVTVTCRVFPTESEERVVEILEKTFPGIRLERRGEYIIGKGDEKTLQNWINTVGREKIAARTYLLLKKKRRGDSIIFPLERDPLAVGKISYGEDGEFPPVWVEIRGDVDEILERIRRIADGM